MRAVVEGAMIGFPIPMRGNEERHRADQDRPDAAVSDPHEG